MVDDQNHTFWLSNTKVTFWGKVRILNVVAHFAHVQDIGETLTIGYLLSWKEIYDKY